MQESYDLLGHQSREERTIRSMDESEHICFQYGGKATGRATYVSLRRLHEPADSETLCYAKGEAVVSPLVVDIKRCQALNSAHRFVQYANGKFKTRSA